MSAWKFMSAKARQDAVLAGRRKLLDAPEIAAQYGAPVDAVERILARFVFTGTPDNDGGSGTPREPAACDAAPTPATPSTPGAGGPDGGSSPVAGVTSNGGGETDAIATAPIEAARAPEDRRARVSPPPQIKAQKSTRRQAVTGQPGMQFTLVKKAKAPATPRAARTEAAITAHEPVETPRASRQGETMLSVWFPQETLVALRARAKKMGMTRAEAAAHLLKGVLKDDKSA